LTAAARDAPLPSRLSDETRPPRVPQSATHLAICSAAAAGPRSQARPLAGARGMP